MSLPWQPGGSSSGVSREASDELYGSDRQKGG